MSEPMGQRNSRVLAPALLVTGALLGMAGTFVPSASLRGLLWGADGIALVGASALLAVHHLRREHDLVAAGFLVFLAGQTLIVSTAAMELTATRPVFGAGTGLWAAALTLVSAPKVMPLWTRVAGGMSAVLFAIVAVRIFSGELLTPLTEPLPFFAYPFLVATLLGWAWARLREEG